MQTGLVLLMAFHVGLLFFGWWLSLYAVPMLGALVLRLRADREHEVGLATASSPEVQPEMTRITA